MNTVDDIEISTAPAMADEADRLAFIEENEGFPGNAARLRLMASMIRLLYSIVIELTTPLPGERS